MKRYMQYIKITSYFLLAIGFFISCDDLLDVKAYSKITNKDIEDSDAGADMWAMGAYNGLSRMYVYDEFPRCMELDNDYVTGPNWAFGELGSGTFQGGNNHADALWKLSYELINRTNEAIHHVKLMENTTETHKNNVLGELYFLQAYGYFLVVRAYGAVPIFERSINQGNDPHQPRQPVTAVYAHIINLLKQSKEMTYKNTDPAFKQGRICAGAAASLLAKVYVTIASSAMPQGTVITVSGGKAFEMNGSEKILTKPQKIKISKMKAPGYESFNPQEYFELAKSLAKEVVDDKLYGNHNLISYSILWKKAGRTSEEHFFAHQTKSADENLGVLFWAYSGQVVNGIIPSGGGLSHGLRSHWYNLFEPQDYRITDGIQHRWVRQSDNTWNGGSYYPNTDEMKLIARGLDSNNNPVAGYPIAPYNDGRDYRSSNGEQYLAYTTKYSDVSDISARRTDALVPLLRYADVVLIYAEALNELEPYPSQKALDLLNAVRLRSNASPFEFGESTSGKIESKEQLRSAIIEERAMEFALEADRRWDLIRWGIYLGVMNAIGAVDEINTGKAREEKHLLYPIPQDELLNNQAINENNPGWK